MRIVRERAPEVRTVRSFLDPHPLADDHLARYVVGLDHLKAQLNEVGGTDTRARLGRRYPECIGMLFIQGDAAGELPAVMLQSGKPRGFGRFFPGLPIQSWVPRKEAVQYREANTEGNAMGYM